MASSLQRASASRACSMSMSMSMPTSAAGSKPNTERALKRPPTVGSPLNTASQPSSCACFSKALPGSVMVTRCLTSSSLLRLSDSSSRTAFRANVGSIVVPLFEEMMTSVVLGLHSDRMPRTRTGESESSVRNFTRAESDLLYLVSVMGACVDPPSPMRMTFSMPSATTRSANF